MPEYKTPGVYIEEISAGPRPVAAAATTDTGFVAVLTMPKQFFGGAGKAAGMFVPASSEVPLLAWNRALAFRALLTDGGAPAAAAPAKKDPKAKAPPAAPKSGNKLQALVDDLLPGKWEIGAPSGDGRITLKSDKDSFLRIPVQSSLVSVIDTDKGKEWDLAWGADEQSMLQLFAGNAVNLGIGHTGNLSGVVDEKAKSTVDIDGIQNALQKTAIAINNLDGYHSWRAEFGMNLFAEIAMQAKKIGAEQAAVLWETLDAGARAAWDRWLRAHPGFLRLETALAGFFTNGGQTAWLAPCLIAEGTGGPNKGKFLSDSFGGATNVAMLAAPGLDFPWQQAILEYAGPSGRGDLFAILETPRYFLTKEPRGRKLNDFRWAESDAPYEMAVLEAVPSPAFTELRFQGFSADSLLDRVVPRDGTGHGAAYGPWLVVDNPVSTSPADKYLIAPPSGHVAGVIAATDLKAGGGVQKAPANELVLGAAEIVTQMSDQEQAALNPKGINIIRHRPFAGLRIWGARTVSSDPLWNYVNVRRLFLFLERSIRDAVGWAVFLPNTNSTRLDLKNTISVFLYTCYNQGMLDGDTWGDAFSVVCDSSNNPDADVRQGLLTVDIQARPVYPAEFVRIRFQQSPMRSEVAEG